MDPEGLRERACIKQALRIRWTHVVARILELSRFDCQVS